MKLIILFAKYNKFKSIVLENESKFYCNESSVDKICYELKYVHTMTKWSTYYYKFGFVFIEDMQNQIKKNY